jgi:hypothetical protein
VIVGAVEEIVIAVVVTPSPRVLGALLTLSSSAPVLRYNSSKNRHHLGDIHPRESITISLIPGMVTRIGVAGAILTAAESPTIVPSSVCACPVLGTGFGGPVKSRSITKS